ncbi:MAG: COX15/CtaA family protein [Allosphingosinicella sp.]|uniref:COX15/CtaA family protein n=1 Tax=Allosphingosinicella sp. TaxID=2823234 RepID=UPI0039357D39
MHAPSDTSTIRPRAISNWLFAVAALVFVMIVVGGITRLTESGLSITRWEPVSGTIPPLTEADWQREFNLYRESPQYQLVNRGMTMDDFKFIFFWEYIHRLLGRVIGLAFALPLAWFAVKRAIPKGYGWKLIGLLALGGLQGVIGWWMVASGLIDVPEVSHIRLAVHLLTALAIFGALIWVALDLRALGRSPVARPARLTMTAIWALCLLFVQMLFGAYVAGLEAGYAFNTWPLMGDEIYPAAAEWLQPALRNFVDNPVTVQFVHRWLAFVAAAVIGLLALQAWQKGDKLRGGVLAVAVLVQIQLGILTILTGVELWIGVAHQGMAALLLGALLMTAHKLGQRREAVAP